MCCGLVDKSLGSSQQGRGGGRDMKRGTCVNEKGALIIEENVHLLKENGHRSDFKGAFIGGEAGTYLK